MSTTLLGIDIGSTKICAVIAQKDDFGIKVLGAGIAKSNGIKKGVITNIDHASKSIKQAITDAKRVAGTQYEKTIVSISGAYTKSVDSSGVVNIPSHEIGLREINRAMQMADHNANIPNEYEKLHVLPYNFKVDEQEFIEDPLGMNGSRLEVEVHIVTAQKSSLSNLKKAVKSAGVEIDNIVLSGYASAISTINSDEKELGVCVVDMGGATCDVVIHSGNSIRFNDFLGVGSNNITNDLSMALHTPLPAAEKVKIDYGYMNSSSNELIELPILGDEQATHEVSLDIISNVIFARVEETLMILAKILEDSGYKDQVGAGVVLTGGLTKLEGIRELATSYFGNLPIRLARPREMEGLFETLRDPGHSTSIGLIMYGSGSFTPYEIDSNKKMRYKDEAIDPGKNVQKILEENDNLKLDKFEEIESPKEKLARIVEGNSSPKKGENVLIKFWHRLTQLF
ncbi:MAG: cell division protein FtsA [Sulfurospirillaceae bacterium]|nr:cell division protein FtsA [Sulfurospirillaceae bacterium]MCK9545575.1 cell division protein FtsA [Sulfurospirillaceae bacterium]MDY0238257.1 cell division protein FtsA [Campylobacterales bacterium]NLM99530.1 cell division protein FtsA [Campylobacteraceae bacterium]